MKYIKLFEIYSEGSELRRKIEHELLEYGISNYTINEDGTVDVNGDVNLGYYKLKILRFPKLDKIPFKFGKVSGSFTIRDNKITSLEGSPYYVGGDFDIAMNNIESFKFGPDEVEGTVYASSNKFKSLEFMPSEIKYDFIVYNNQLKELDSVSNIEGDIFCDPNLDKSKFRGYCQNIHDGSIEAEGLPVASALNECLKDLESELEKFGIQNYTINEDGTVDVNGDVNIDDMTLSRIPFKFGKVTGNFYCSDNSLTSLEGSPREVGGSFYCSDNKLKDLKGSPIEVDKGFFCYANKLNSIEGMPIEIGGDFNCRYNANLREFNSISNIEGKIWCDRHVDTSKFLGYSRSIVKI
jgi:hypothetical protein